MIKIDSDKTIHISRGDAVTINVTANSGTYEFKQGDEVKLRVYEKNGYDKEPVLEKEIKVTETTNSVLIVLTEEDMSFASDISKKQTYWYDISLNEVNTIIGFDEDGAKKMVIYPAKLKGDK